MRLHRLQTPFGQETPMPAAPVLLSGLFSIFCFSISDAAMKAALGAYDPYVVVLIRMTISVILGLLYLRSLRQPVIIYNKAYILAGAVLFMMEYLGFITAMKYLPLAELMVIILLAPPVVAGLSALFLHEKLTARQMAALALAVVSAGVMVVLGQGVSDPTTVFPAENRWIGVVLGGVCVLALAARNISVRRYGLQENPVTTIVAISALCAIMSLPFAAMAPTLPVWQPHAAGLIVAGSITAFIGFVAFLRALQNLPASILQPLQYSQLLWASLFGMVFFAEIPTLPVLLGAAGVIIAGILFYAAPRHTQP